MLLPVNKAFNPSGAYEAKNYYFNRANELFLRNVELSDLYAEMYYLRMLTEISNYEQESGKHFNKGMVYANLGIARILAGKFDLGIADFL